MKKKKKTTLKDHNSQMVSSLEQPLLLLCIPSNINEENGDVADDHYHYHRYLEDIEIMHSLGVNAYRFSISWARVLPNFLHLAETCFKSFGDRVKYWITITGPNLFTDMAYIRGKYPPARCSVPFGNCSVGNSDMAPLVVMHMLLAHAKAVKIYREHFLAKQGGVIGIVVCVFMNEPMTESELDWEAANQALAFNVAWDFDPLYLEITLRKCTITTGMNYQDCIYSSCILGGDRPIRGFGYITGERNGIPIGDRTGMANFFLVPRGMEKVVNYVKGRYHNKPMYVLENGE
ncbi:beta glucosidase 15 [Actinidia rufa]|uniref:Beta glucosidase 15 n=1 Tax=Actinidia rufa TaxID=165716 RepID=A0A7J0GKH1_9ERIC|nr:beta glucosidase 15 [Actinidia rufa]